MPQHGELPALSGRTHLRYAIIAVTAPCALFGAGAGLILSAYRPAGLVLALIVVVSLYGILVFAGKRTR